jgi:hypothetical protein
MRVQDLFEYDTKKIDAFMAAIKKESTPDPGTKNGFWHQRVFFIIRPQRYSQSVHLEEIKSPDMGSGKGTAALTWFLNVADKFGVPVTLHPVQLYKDIGPTKEQLTKWYTRHGFESDPGSAIMRREPKKRIKESVDTIVDGESYFVDHTLTAAVIAPPAMYDIHSGTEIKITGIRGTTAYFDIPKFNVSAYAPLVHVQANVITKKDYDRKWLNGLKENIADDLVSKRRWVIRPITVTVDERQMWGKTVPPGTLVLNRGDIVVQLSNDKMALTNRGGGTFSITPDIADAFVKKKQWDREWLNGLKESPESEGTTKYSGERDLVLYGAPYFEEFWGYDRGPTRDVKAFPNGTKVHFLYYEHFHFSPAKERAAAVVLIDGKEWLFKQEQFDKCTVTPREYRVLKLKWLKSLKEEKHPLDLQIAKEMAIDHIIDKGYIPWDADLWHSPAEEGDNEWDHTYGEYNYGDNIDAYASDMQSLHKNHKVMDVHVSDDQPMFFNPKTEEFLIPVSFLYVDEEKIMKHGDHGMSTLDRDSRGRYGHSDDVHEANRTAWIKVDINHDKTDQVLDLHDEIPQWNRTPEYRKLKSLSDLHDDPTLLKDRFDKLQKKFTGQATQWVKITDQDKLEEAAHPLDFQIACETAREYVIDHGHEFTDVDDVAHLGPEHYEDWIIDHVHVDIHRESNWSRPAYYNEKTNSYLIPITYDWYPKDPHDRHGMTWFENTVYVLVPERGEAKTVDYTDYVDNRVMHTAFDHDDPRFNKIKERLGVWREIYGPDSTSKTESANPSSIR